ncbi:hypothetical protein YC2023_009322 [Brassica napus]
MLKMKKWALEWKFEYEIVYSSKSRVILRCVDEICSWRMCATKLSWQDFFVHMIILSIGAKILRSPSLKLSDSIELFFCENLLKSLDIRSA